MDSGPSALCRAFFAIVNATSWRLVHFDSERILQPFPLYEGEELARTNISSLELVLRTPECYHATQRNSILLYSNVVNTMALAERAVSDGRQLLVLVLRMSPEEFASFQRNAHRMPLTRWLFLRDSIPDDIFEEQKNSKLFSRDPFYRCIMYIEQPADISVPVDWRTCAHQTIQLMDPQPETFHFRISQLIHVCREYCFEHRDGDRLIRVFAALVNASRVVKVDVSGGSMIQTKKNALAFKLLRTRRTDIGMRLFARHVDRLTEIDYLKTIWWSKLVFYSCRNKRYRTGSVGLFQIFTAPCWLMIGFSFMACVGVNSISRTFSDAFIVTIGMFLQKPNTIFAGNRFIHVSTVVAIFVIYSIFQQMLTSYCNVPVSATLETVEDFTRALAKPHTVVCFLDTDFTSDMVNEGASSVFRAVSNLQKDNRVVRVASEDLCLAKMLAGCNILSLLADCDNCAFNLALDRGKEEVKSIMSSYAITPGFPWKHRLNRAIAGLFEAHYFEVQTDWKAFNASAQTRKSQRQSNVHDTLSLDVDYRLQLRDFWFQFVILLTGLTLASGVYVKHCIEYTIRKGHT